MKDKGKSLLWCPKPHIISFISNIQYLKLYFKSYYYVPVDKLVSFFSPFSDSLHRSVAIHVPYVSIGCLHSIVSGRSGYHQSLQIATNVENEEARRVGDTHLHHIHSNRYIWIRSYFVVYHTYLSLFNPNSAHRRAALQLRVFYKFLIIICFILISILFFCSCLI